MFEKKKKHVRLEKVKKKNQSTITFKVKNKRSINFYMQDNDFFFCLMNCVFLCFIESNFDMFTKQFLISRQGPLPKLSLNNLPVDR